MTHAQADIAKLLGQIEAVAHLKIAELRSLVPAIGERYGDIDAACIAGHLRAIFAGPKEAWSFLSNSAAITRVIEQRKVFAASLVTCVKIARPFPFSLRHAFGMLTPAHEAVMRQAICSGTLGESDACRLAFNGDLLTSFLGAPSISVPLSFETSLGTACRPSARARYPSLPVHAGRSRFEIIVSNGYELWRATNFNALEPETVRWIDKTMKPGDVLYDVGANIGIFSLCAATKSPEIQVVGFEPEPLNFARLNENIALNRVVNMLTLPVALSDVRGFGVFTSRDMAPGSTSPFATESGVSGAHRSGCILDTLDAVASSSPRFPAPSHLKIDVDGSQLSVLRGAQHTLTSPTLRQVLVELFEDEMSQVDGMLGNVGLVRSQCHFHTNALGTRGRVGNVIYVRGG